MTEWIGDPTGGRDRGLRGLGLAWATVIARPVEFFEEAVSPGDQAPGLVFALIVVFVEELARFALVPDAYPVVADAPVLSGVLWLAVATLLVAPVALHLLAALQTILLLPLAPNRGGVSETVQVFAYATAPCLFAGLPIAPVRIGCALYGSLLLWVGTAVVHDVTYRRSAILATLPAALCFGYGFRGFDAVATQLTQWYII